MKHSFLKPLFKAVRLWYIPLLVGILFVIVSIIAFASPLTSFVALAILFSLSFLFSGISEIVFSLSNRNELDNWGWHLVFGLITAAAGMLLFLNPGISMTLLAFYVGFIVLFRSIAMISFSIDLKKYRVPNWGILLTLGILGAIISFILIWNPVVAGVSVGLLIGLSLLITGLVSIFFSFQLKKLHTLSKKIKPELKERFERLQEEIRDSFDS